MIEEKLIKNFASRTYFDPHSSLMELPVVKWTLGVISFVASFAAICILSKESLVWNLTSIGFNDAVKIFQVPLGILALLIPTVAMLAANHRSEQSREQMRIAGDQNIFSNHYKHVEEFEGYCESLLEQMEKRYEKDREAYKDFKNIKFEKPFPVHVSLRQRRLLYKKIFPYSKIGVFHIDGEFLKILDKAIEAFVELFNEAGTTQFDMRESKLLDVYSFVLDFTHQYNLTLDYTYSKKVPVAGRECYFYVPTVGSLLNDFEKCVDAIEEILRFDVEYVPSKIVRLGGQLTDSLIAPSIENFATLGPLEEIKNQGYNWNWALTWNPDSKLTPKTI